MRSYSVRKLIPPTVLSVRIVTKCRITVYVLNIIVGSLSPAFRKIIRLKKPCMNVFPGFSQVQDPRGIIIVISYLHHIATTTTVGTASVPEYSHPIRYMNLATSFVFCSLNIVSFYLTLPHLRVPALNLLSP